MDKLPDEFIKIINSDIEEKVLPNLDNMFPMHYPHLKIAYRPKNPESFLFAYVIGSLESSYQTKFIQDYGLAEYNADVYFAIHRLVREYREQIITKVKEFLKK